MANQQLGVLLQHLRRVAARKNEDDLTDGQLLERFVEQGEEAAFAALLRRHGPMVLGVCRGVLRRPHDVEDAFQAAFLILAQKAASIRRGESIGSWLHSVAYNVALKARTRAARAAVGQASQPDQRTLPDATQTDPLDDLTMRELRQALHEELRRLPEKYRTPLVLCYLEGKTQEEAAHQLGWPRRRVKDRLQRGREQLRRRLQKRGLVPMAALGTALFAADNVSAAVPAALASATMRGAVQVVPMTASVAALVEAGGAILPAGKAKAAMVFLLAVTLLGSAVVGASRGLTARGDAPISAAPPQPSAERRLQPPPPAQAEEKDAVAVSGRVLGPDGKPLAGAKVYYHFITHQEEPLPVRATTDAQGRFAFTLTPKDVPLSADSVQSEPRNTGHVIVKADGFTFAWHGIAKKQTDLTLRVAADDTPLTGRIIDLQGKPLAGLRVTALSVAAPEKGDLTPLVKALQARQPFYNALFTHAPNYLVNPLVGKHRIALLPTAKTDANGRFRLHGFAKEQIVEARVEGAAVETQDLFVMTRLAPREGGVLLSAPRVKDPFFGPSERVVVLPNGFDHPLPPGLTVTGTVRDADTKRPIPRAIVESHVLAGTKLSQNTLYHTVAGEQGRYRFTGLPRGKGNRIRIRPPADLPYVPVVKDVPVVKLFAEATVDAALSRGVWVDVTVADKATGRPVPGYVSYFVYPEKRSPARPFEQPFQNEYDNFMPVRNDGTFRFVAVPRRAILAFRADWKKYPIAREAATIDFPFGISSSNFQAFAPLNPKAGDAPVKVKFVLDAGGIVKGRILDPEGRPLSSALATNLRDDWYGEPDWPLKTPDFTVLGLHPDHPRLVCFVHPQKKLAGSVVVRGNEKQPIRVKLQPWATVSGRLLEARGKPIPNAELRFTEVPVRKPGQPMSLDTGLHVVEHIGYQPSPDPRTDEQGRFRIERLVPGLKYNLALMDERGATKVEEIKWLGLVFTELVLKPGESKELGDRKLQSFPTRPRPGGRDK
jgi:RNA polymerase sigma factor (sigma-70 family)